jgi:signal peptidase II
VFSGEFRANDKSLDNRYSFAMTESTHPKSVIFWPTFILVFFLDFGTKRWAEQNLLPLYTPHPLIGEMVRLTLAFNKDAAMGLSLGQYSRIGFTLIAGVVLVVLGVFYRRTPPFASAHAFGLALVAAGALGNLADRVLFSHGVVDFIDVGIGTSRFWTFNVADAAITCGAVLLAILSMKDHRDAEPVVASAHTTP